MSADALRLLVDLEAKRPGRPIRWCRVPVKGGGVCGMSVNEIPIVHVPGTNSAARLPRCPVHGTIADYKAR